MFKMGYIHSVNKSILSDERLLQLSKNTNELFDLSSLKEESNVSQLLSIQLAKCSIFSELLTPASVVTETISKKEYDKARSSSGRYFYKGVHHGIDSPNQNKAAKFNAILAVVSDIPTIVRMGFEVESAHLDLIFAKLDLPEYQTLITETDMLDEYLDWKDKHELFKAKVKDGIDNEYENIDHSIRETREELRTVLQHLINEIDAGIYLKDPLFTPEFITKLNKIIDDQMIPARISHTREKNEREAEKKKKLEEENSQ